MRSDAWTHILHRVVDVTAFVEQAARTTQLEAEVAAQTLEVRDANERLRQAKLRLDHQIDVCSRQSELLRNVLLAVPLPVALLKGAGHRIELQNIAMRQLLADAEAIDADLASSARGLHKVLPLLDRVYHDGEVISVRRLAIVWPGDASGETGTRYYDLHVHPYLASEAGVEGVILAAVDVTAHVEGEASLKAALSSLEDERDLRDQFVLALSHDLRTPLSAASMGSHVISRKADDAGEVRRISGRVLANLERIDHMLRDLLDANRITAGGKLTLSVVSCDLREVVEQVVDDLSTVHGDRFIVRAPVSLPGRWDCATVRRALENLCVNAISYGAPGRPVTVTLADSGAETVIEVHNEGRPIPIDEQSAIFTAHFRRPTHENSARRGWGLGLTLVRGLVEAHGGTVEVESAEGQGTVFRIRLPRQ
ncbi:sensor histidine kinase [Lysobacter korlensis]|uniref:histidine kinase n=1 Tax=Lysobacter korlensis TaxID=553636 RepID=A0ABV6RMQ0_9GAMM